MAHYTLDDLTFVRSVNIPNLSLLLAMHDAWCNTLVDLIFVRTVNIPNLRVLPCFEVFKFFLDKRNITYEQMHKAIYWGSMLPKNHLGFWCYTVLWNWGSWGQLYTTHYVLWNWTFTGVICDQNDPNNNKWRQNELKNSPWVIVLHSALELGVMRTPIYTQLYALKLDFYSCHLRPIWS